MMSFFPRHAAAVLIALAAGACTSFLPGTGPAPNIYDLSPKSTFDADIPAVRWQLIVEVPNASRGIDTDRIVIRPNANEILYLKGAKWSNRAPEMVQTLLTESFENTGKIVGVGRRSIGLSGEFVLRTDLREFQAERVDGGVQVRVHMSFKLVHRRKGIIFASENFEAVVPAASDATVDIVAAFDDALGRVMKRGVSWTLRTGESNYAGMEQGTGQPVD